MNIDIETIAMELVGAAGASKRLSFEGLTAAKNKDFDLASKKLEEAKRKMLIAHEIQTDLICKEADEGKLDIGYLLIHAQDHLMTAMLAKDLIEELIEVYKKLD